MTLINRIRMKKEEFRFIDNEGIKIYSWIDRKGVRWIGPNPRSLNFFKSPYQGKEKPSVNEMNPNNPHYKDNLRYNKEHGISPK